MRPVSDSHTSSITAARIKDKKINKSHPHMDENQYNMDHHDTHIRIQVSVDTYIYLDVYIYTNIFLNICVYIYLNKYI